MPMRTIDRFIEVQEQLLRYLVKSIIHIAEAASLFNRKDGKQQLVDNPRRHWIKKAMNEWKSEIELERVYSSRDRSFCSPGSKERRQCRLVMDIADQDFSAHFPNISIASRTGGTCDLSLNDQDDPWQSCQDQPVSSVLEMATPQIIADSGKEYDAIDFQGENPGVESSVSQSPESLQPHDAEHMLRGYPAIAYEHSMCEAYRDEPPAFTSAITDRIWPGNQYNHGDPSKTLQPSSIENLFSPQIFTPLPSLAFDSSSSYDYSFQPSGSHTISSLHGDSRLAQSPCPLGSVVTHADFPGISSSWPIEQFHPITDVSTTNSMSRVNEIPYPSPQFPAALQDCDFHNEFLHRCLHEQIIPETQMLKEVPHPSESACWYV